MPASNARALEKARSLPADVIIIDLEDAVAPEAKPAARLAAVQAVNAGGYGSREVVIRVNGLDTDWGVDDLSAALASKADALLLPKITCADDVVDVIQRLDGAGAGTMPIWVMAELPQAVLNMASIAALAPRLAVIIMGTADLARAMRLTNDSQRTGLLPALGHCVLAARARGIDILDGIYVEFRDHSGFREACRQGKALGFDGKTLIHPDQIAAANEIFGVSADAAAEARRIVTAWEEATLAGRGIAVLDGRMIERLHAEEAQRLLVLYEATQPL
jgi:citrate lyase subunit beta/citryl-CoA lyase